MSKANAKSDKLNFLNWILVLVLFLFTLVAGYVGFQHYMTQHGESFNWVRPIYRTIQLFSTEGGDLEEPIPKVLHVVRFTAPLTAIVAIILALFVIFREQINRIRISFLRNHVVIIGLGTKGKNIMNDSLKKKGKILVIEQDPLNPNLASLKPRKCLLIEGNATNIDVLKKARITRAKKVYLMMGDDSEQVQVCVLIYDLIKGSERSKENSLECNMHLLNHDYLNILRKHTLVKNVNDGLSLNVFNLYENSARELFQENPPDRTGIPEQSNKYVQLIIFGFGQAGEALAIQCGLTGHYLNRKTSLPRVVVFDRHALEKIDAFKKKYPSFTNYCNLSFETIEASSPQLIPELEKYLADPEALNTIVLCFDNKINNLMLGLQIDTLTPSTPAIPFQVFIRTGDNDSFDAISKNLKPYGLPASVCSLNAITGCDLDKQARAVHADFLKIRKTKANFGSQDSDVEWEELSQEFKDSNRKAADHMGVKMRGIGCQIVLQSDPRPETKISPAELELLAELEHCRWNAERSLAGWTYDSVKSNKTRTTPYLVDWDKLTPDIQQYDRDAVANIPNVLKEAGLKIVR
jgi:hypothetical protein